jgi:hypothetical protein
VTCLYLSAIKEENLFSRSQNCELTDETELPKTEPSEDELQKEVTCELPLNTFG